MVQELKSLDEFFKVITDTNGKLVVIDFTAVWCGPCKKIAPLYEEFCITYTDVIFCKADVDDVPDLAEHCKIKAMPTFQFYKCQKKVGEITGADAAKLKKKIEELK